MLDDQWLAEQLVADGLVDAGSMDQLQRSRDPDKDLCRALIQSGTLEEAAILRFLGLRFKTRYVSTEKLSTAKVVQWVLDLLPAEFCQDNSVLPVRCDKERTTLSIVTPDPSDARVINETIQHSGVAEVMAYVALPHAIEAGIRRFYRGDLHAFARMDQSLRQDYSEMMNIYEQRLIDFNEPEAQADEPPTQEAFRHDEVVLEPDGSPSMEVPAVKASTPAAPATPTAATAPAAATAPKSGMSPVLTPAPAAVFGASPSVSAEAMGNVIAALLDEFEAPRGWRANHSTEVARMVGTLATKSGMSAAEVANTQLVALLHELGKPTGMHLTVLNVTDPAARAQAMTSYRRPVDLVSSAGLPSEVLQALSALYERPDGGGAPGQMNAAQIPAAARLVQVVDAYCDLVSNPEAPGGQCDPTTAMRRLKEAATSGALEASLVDLLAGSGGDRVSTSGRPLVLIIDEDSRSAALLEGQLKSSGYDAVVASTTGDAALVLLGENVALVLSEVNLTPMDGFTFLEWISSNKRTNDIPFMFVSSRAEPDDVNRGFELGAVDYIVKPFRPEVVLAKIKRTIGAR